MGKPYLQLPDGSVWPNPNDPSEVEYRLRYGTHKELTAASYIAAYKELVFSTIKHRNEICAALKAALEV